MFHQRIHIIPAYQYWLYNKRFIAEDWNIHNSSMNVSSKYIQLPL